jgi:hypothetical protein
VALIQLALILVYTVVLLIKTCMVSSEACAMFGFGDQAGGLYLFFVFFGFSMLLLQLILGTVHLYVMGQCFRSDSNRGLSHVQPIDQCSNPCADSVPKLLLVAKAHGVSPMVIVQSTPAGIDPKTAR